MSHHDDDFYAAVSALAGHGHIKQRLVEAFEKNLQDIDEDDLPIPLKQRFSDLRHMMTRVAPLNGEGPICASVRKMSVDEADTCAQLMVDLYGDAIRFGGQKQASLPLDVRDTPAPPPFLVKSI
jgi:hypothetical protein